MAKWLMDKLFGHTSLRFQMTILYVIIFVSLSIVNKLDAVAFATFSGIYGAWIISETCRKAE